MRLKLGHTRNKNNDIVLSDKTISGEHAEVELMDEGCIFLKNLSRTNPLIKNGMYIDESTIVPGDFVQIGDRKLGFEELKKKIMVAKFKDRREVIEEFTLLEEVFKQRSSELHRLRQKDMLKKRGIQGGVMIVFLLPVYFLFPKMEQTLRIIISMSVSALLGFAISYFMKGEKLQRKNREIRNKFQYLLTCPRCEYSLSNISFEEAKDKKECPKCSVRWVK